MVLISCSPTKNIVRETTTTNFHTFQPHSLHRPQADDLAQRGRVQQEHGVRLVRGAPGPPAHGATSSGHLAAHGGRVRVAH